MSNKLTTLCLIHDNAYVNGDWSRLECETKRVRKVDFCLTKIYQYDAGHIPVAIDDWATAKEQSAINVGELFPFEELTEVLSRLAPQESGLYVYSGDIPPTCDACLHKIQRPGEQFKLCQASPHFRLRAASYASSPSRLIGFEADAVPDSHFTLGWFPIDDPMKDVILREWDRWPNSECHAMLPAFPSPSNRSVELVKIGQDQEEDAIGVFMGDDISKELSIQKLRRLFGEDAIIAALHGVDLWQWLENGCDLDVLSPVDRQLPFQTAQDA